MTQHAWTVTERAATDNYRQIDAIVRNFDHPSDSHCFNGNGYPSFLLGLQNTMVWIEWIYIKNSPVISRGASFGKRFQPCAGHRIFSYHNLKSE